MMLRIFDDTLFRQHISRLTVDMPEFSDLIVTIGQTTEVNTLWTAEEAAVLLGMSDIELIQMGDNFREAWADYRGELSKGDFRSQYLHEYIRKVKK